MAATLIPQNDPKAEVVALRREIVAAIDLVLEGGQYILGGEVTAFEAEFAAYLGAAHGIGVGNGTDALVISLRAAGIGPGDLVFTVSHTAVATVAAIELTGARVVLVDIDPITYTIDPDLLNEAIVAHSKNTGLGRPKAIVAVHLYGQPADMPAILDIAKRHGLVTVEDCAQAHGAALGDRRMGCWGDVAAFSFYPTKNLGAIGDGGAVVTSDTQIAERARMLREYGWRQRNLSKIPGMNSRLDELQAAILRVKLRHLDNFNDKRRLLAQEYSNNLRGPILPMEREGAHHVYHQYVVRSPHRDELRSYLTDLSIYSAVHYPHPVHLQPAYQGRIICHRDLEASTTAAREVLSLPMYTMLATDEARRIAEAVCRFYERH